MPIYDRPTKELMKEFAEEKLSKGQIFTKNKAAQWFSTHYPNIKTTTVKRHVDGMSVNSASRQHHPSIKPGSGHDLFFKVGRGDYRLWDSEKDPQPLYKADIEKSKSVVTDDDAEEFGEEAPEDDGYSSRFAYERDLKNYLANTLGSLEPGLKLYEEEGLTGIEYPVGGRFIDILAVDAEGDFVVIELKVSKGYDRVIGQLLRYMSWIEKNLTDGKKVRGWIIAREISEDLKLATARVPDVSLFEYEISFAINAASLDG